MPETSFWIASHVTGFFEIVDNENFSIKGSRGAGFNLARGITTRISTSAGSGITVFFNGEKIPLNEAIVTREVVKQFFNKSGVEESPVVINHAFEIPLSTGFGASAGGALGTAFCLNELFKTSMSRQELFEIAHIAETKHWCGLGDVLGLYKDSGTEIRIRPGAPEYGATVPFSIEASTRLFTCSFGKLHTAEVLTNSVYRQKIIEKGKEEVRKLLDAPSSATFMSCCREFSDFVGLYSEKARQVINAFTERGLETPAMIMLGDGLFIMTRDRNTLECLESDMIPFSIFREDYLTSKTVKKVG